MVILSMIVVLELVVIVTGHVNLAAYDRLDLVVAVSILVLAGILEEFLHSIEVAMVRDGQSRHSELFCTVEQLSYV